MTVTTGTSFLMAIISAVLIFSGMQMYKLWLTSSQLHTLFGGYLGSVFFIICLTAVGNLETVVFGKPFQIKLFPEVAFCLFLAIFTAATVHRVCATSCFLFSLFSLYYMNKYSQRVHVMQSAPAAVPVGRKKKNAM